MIRITAAVAVLASLSAPCFAGLDLAGVDRGLDACADFYAYANRRWIESTAIPDDRPVWGSFAMLDERNQQLLKGALADALERPLPSEPGKRKVLQYYASGMDLAAIARAGLRPLEPQLRASAPSRSLPIFRAWSRSCNRKASRRRCNSQCART